MKPLRDFFRVSLDVAVLMLCVSSTFAADDLKPFATDGCSEFPEGTPDQRNLWLDCCIAHDKAYWLGGNYAARQKADEELRACVEEVGQPEIALLMLAGVRVGGSPFWNTRYRWGYGWPYWDGWLPRGYKKLSEGEKAQAAKMTAASP